MKRTGKKTRVGSTKSVARKKAVPVPVSSPSYKKTIKEKVVTKKQEHYFATNTLGALGIGMWESDVPANKLQLTDEARKLLGLKKNSFLSLQKFASLFVPSSSVLFKEALAKAAGKAKAFHLELELPAAQGKVKWIRVACQPIRQKQQVVALTGFFQDITLQKTNASSREIDLLMNNTEESFVLVDKTLKIVTFNTAFEKGYKQFLGKQVKKGDAIIDYVQPERKQIAAAIYARVLAGETAGSEIEIPHTDRPPSVFSLIYKPARDENGDIIGVFVTTRDITTQKRSQQLLAESEKRFKAIVENGSDAVAILSAQGKVIYTTPSVSKILGYTGEELARLDLFSLMHPEDVPRVMTVLEKALAHPGVAIRGHTGRIRNQHGEWRWLEATVTNMLHDPAIGGIVDNFRDVTEKIETDRRIKEERALFRTVIDNLPINVYTKDIYSRKTLANKADYTYSGFVSEEEVLGKNDVELFDEASAVNTLEEDQHIFRTGHSIIGKEECHIKKDGSATWFLISKIPLKNAVGKITGLLGISFDISERKAAEEEVRLAKERYDMVARVTNDAIYEWDMTTNFSYWGEGYETLFGHKRTGGKMLSGSWTDYIHPEEKDRLSADLAGAIEKKTTSLTRELRFQCADGSYKTVFDKLVILYSQEGRPLKIIGAMQDITAQKLQELSIRKLNDILNKRAKELSESNAELERFAYVASHDLQEPLRMVSSFLGLLEKKYKERLDETALQYIRFAVEGADRMKRLIMDLLEYSRVGSNRDLLSNTDMNEVMSQVLDTFARKIQETGAQVKTTALPVIKANGMQVLQLLQNLISNAFKYNTSPVPEITIGYEEKPDCWQFFVKDNGIGIDPKFFEKVFVIFQRLHKKDEFSGTGVGLAICRKIVEKHGGHIWIASEPGQGSTFFFTIKK